MIYLKKNAFLGKKTKKAEKQHPFIDTASSLQLLIYFIKSV